jgi:hypothetical protein
MLSCFTILYINLVAYRRGPGVGWGVEAVVLNREITITNNLMIYFLNLSPSILFESGLVGSNLELHYDSVFVLANFILKRLFANPICAINILSL